MRSWQKQALRLFIFGIFTINFLSLCIAVNTPLEPDSKGFTVDLMKGLGVRLTNGTNDLNVVPRLMKSSLLQSTANEIKDPEEFKIMPKTQGFSLPSWGGLEFEFRKNITIPQSNVPSNLGDFPVLIDLYRDSDLFGVQQANGNDIMFTDTSGNKLAHEIEKFDPNEPHLIAWVKTDLSSSTDNIISMYFGNSTIGSQENPTGVWNNNYAGIYHLMEDPTGTIYDSTENNNDGTSSGGMTASNQVEGLIDGSVEFDGTNDLINIGDVNSDSWSGITVETWYFHDASGDDRVICKSPSGVTADHIFSLALVTGDQIRIRLSTDGSGGSSAVNQDSAGTISIGTWHHIAFTWDSVSKRVYLYIDGSQDSNNYFKDGESIQDSVLPVIIGNVNTGADDRYFDGRIDEARISNVSRSSNWLATQFSNQYNPNSFYTLGPLEGPSPYDFFRYKKTITINHTKVPGTNDLNNFIILADIIDPDFQDNNKIEADGSNLVFINRETNNYLYCEIESFDQNYDSNNGRLVAWIKVDSLSATNDTIIDMYYGNKIHSSYLNSEEVWSDYVGVWHLGEVVSDEGTAVNIHEDGTINSNNGNQHGNDDFINGTIHLAQNFDGTNDYIEMGDPTSLELNGDSYYTFSGWFYRDTTSSTDVILDKFHPRFPEYTGYSLWIDGSDGLLYFRTADDDDDGFTLKSTSNFNTLPTGWYYYTITFDTSPPGVSTPANMQIYINGTNDNAVASLWGIGAPTWDGNDDFNPANNLADFTIGSHTNQSNYFDGKLDEIRITERLLSNDWIMTEYSNQHDPQSFYSVSSEVENSNWWHNNSFTRRKDFQIDNQIFGNPDEGLILRPRDNGGDDHYDINGALSEYLATSEAEPDQDSSYIYTSVNNLDQYFSYKTRTLPIPFEGTISKITLYSRVRHTGTVISANIRNYITWGGQRYYGNYRSISAGYTTYSDEWTLNPVSGEIWKWDDFVDIEFGLRGIISYTISQQLRVTQMYAIISFTSNKSLWDFPLLVELSNDPDLKTDTQANGNDILFYDEVGHKLEHEIVAYISNSSHANLTAFIKVPRLQLTKNSYISMYYGNQTISNQEHSQETWDNNFLAVYHMEESPSNDIIDSKGNYNLTPEASMNSANSVSGKITQAIDFDGIDDQLYTTQTITIDSFTISSWINYDSGSGWRTLLNIDRSTAGNFRDFGILNNVPFFDDGTTQSFGGSLSASTWYHIVFTFDSSTSALRCYVNGVQVGSTVFRDIQTVTDDFQVGAWDTTDYFDGLIDELRISDNSRSNAWIDLEYANQLNPTTYITIGGEYDRASPNVTDFNVDDPGDGSPTFWANVTDQDSPVSSVSIEINGTSYPMSLNGSGFWIYQPSSVTFNDYYTYLIDNATDTAGNYLDATSTTESITFDYDTLAPQVLEWEFYDVIDPYGTFKANVSDDWGTIDTVIVNVTYHENMADTSSLWAVMRNTSSGFKNNTLNMIEGTINFVVTVNDTNGNSYTSTEHVSYVTNTSPVASNPNLSRDELLVLTPVFSNSTFFILYDYLDAEGDGESGSEIRWYKWNSTDWVLQAAFNDQKNISSTALVRGETWYTTVLPRDGKDFGNFIESSNITIQNSAPNATNLAILPLNPTTNTILTAYYDWSDVDTGDTEQNSQIRWYRDNVNGSGFLLLSNYNNLLEIPIDETAKGNQFYFTITPNDGYANGNVRISSIILIENSPPSLIVKINNHTQPERVETDTDLNATMYIYSDPDNLDNTSVDQFNINFLNVTWWWYNPGSGNFELQGAYNESLLISNSITQVNDLWRCDMRISDETISSGWISSATISIGAIPNKAPIAIFVNLTDKSNPVAGGYLNVSYTYTDEEGDEEAQTTFRWYKNGINQPQFDGLKYLSIAIFVKGDNWTAQVKPQDSKNDYGEWNSSETIFIENTAPVATIAEIYPSTGVFTSNTLLADYQGFDADDDLLSETSIVWLNGSVEVQSLYNQTEVSSTYTKKGEIWSYIIRIYDGTAWSTNKSSGSVTIQNTPPSFDNVILTGGLDALDDINVSYSFVDIDNDSIDLGKTKINWTIEIEGGGSTDVNGIWYLSSTNFAAGDFVTVEITPHDGDNYGQPWEKFRVRIIVGNGKPQIIGTPNILDPDNNTIFYASVQLHVNYSAWDPDSGSRYNLTYDEDGLVSGAEYRWYKNGEWMSELTNPIVPVSYLVRGDIWNVSVRPRDQYGDFGNWTTSPTITIINSPPDVYNFIEVNPTTTSEMDLELDFTYSDYDHNPINVSKTMILWYLNGSLIPGTENGTVIDVIPIGNDFYVRLYLSRIHYARGDNVSVFVRAFDSYDWDLENGTSNNITIANSLPYFDEVIITGGDNTSINMGLNLTFIDYDHDLIDSVQTKINWTIELSGGGVIQVDGVLTLDSSYFAAGDYITVEITPHDGTELGQTWEKYRERKRVGNADPSIVGSPNILGKDDSKFYYSSEFLVINYTATDPDIGLYIYELEFDENDFVVGAEYRWYRNDELMINLTDPYVNNSYLVRGNIWKVSVRPRDRNLLYGDWINSSTITIINSPPEIISIVEVTPSITTNLDLELDFRYNDFDNDQINLSQLLILWYRNGTLLGGTENNTVISQTPVGNYTQVRILLPSIYYSRGDNISVIIRPYDSYDWAFENSSSAIITIVNFVPIVQTLSIKPNGSDLLSTYTTDFLNVSWFAYDADGDQDISNESLAIIKWYKFEGVLFVEQTSFENQTFVQTNTTTKGDIWYVFILVFDGYEFSIGNASIPIIISNSPPVVESFTIRGNIENQTADITIVINQNQDVNSSDPDNDAIIGMRVYWFKNDTYQAQFENQTEIQSSALFKRDRWYAIISVQDIDLSWSENFTSQIILMINKAPEVDDITLVSVISTEFIVEDEDIILDINVSDIDQGDTDLSTVEWYINDVYFPQYDNEREFSSIFTRPGDNWTATISPYDGTDFGTSENISFTIESRPKIENFTVEIFSDIEGEYRLSFKVNDSRNNPISDARFEIFLNGSLSSTIDTTVTTPNGTDHWVLDYSLNDYEFLNSEAVVGITVRSQTTYYAQLYYIPRNEAFNILLADGAAPRVISARFGYDDAINPTTITFHAEIQEFGTGIEAVTVYYLFTLANSTGGNGATISQELQEIEMEYQNKTGNVFVYSISVDFPQEQADIDIYYRIATQDSDGNINSNAFDNTNLPDRFTSPPLGLPEEVLLIAVVIILITFVGSIVYVKFIRKPEVRGLDKDLVMEGITKITEGEIMSRLDSHTIGIVVSFFHQAHGPIPIICVPELLRDNWSKLMELSDRAFSGTQFSDDFSAEIVSNYDFILDRGLHVSVMSFGYSLDRPEARGGQENITANILVHKEIFPLLNQFQEEIQPLVHETHDLMNREPDEKQKITEGVLKLRKHITAIVLSYEKIYGTTELIEEED